MCTHEICTGLFTHVFQICTGLFTHVFDGENKGGIVGITGKLMK